MRRIPWIRFERQRRLLLTIGLAFTLGALTAAVLIWRVDQLQARAAAEMYASAGSDHPRDGRPSQEDSPDPKSAGTSGYTSYVDLLKNRHLEMPVEGVARDQLRDSYDEGRSGGLRKHEAIDIMAARGTRVMAVENGRIARLFTSVPGGLTIYVFDPSATFCYYYAHLDRYAPGLKEGQQVRRGELLGYVGTTGNASEDAPHLHFAILHLGDDRKWWKGDPINPYAVLR